MTRKRTDAPRASLTRLFALLACVLVSVAPVACRADADTPDDGRRAESMELANELVSRLVERYEASNSYLIEFSQETFWSLADTVYASAGKLLVEHPLKVSIRYDDGSVVTSNGESLWVYTSQTNQFFATSVDSNDVVIDPPRLLRQYEPDPTVPFAARSPEGRAHGDVVLSLRPRGGAQEPAHMDVHVNERELLVTVITAHSTAGDWTRYRVLSTEFDVPTAPSDFVFLKPEGAQSISGSGADLR